MARLLVTSNSGNNTAEIFDEDDGYRWACTCGKGGQHHRQPDVIDHALTHVDNDHD